MNKTNKSPSHFILSEWRMSSMVTISVGIDIAKLDFMAAVNVNEKLYTNSFKNNPRGFKQLLTWLDKFTCAELHFCMESTGKYGIELAAYLFHQGKKVSIVNPAKIKYFAKSQLTRNKTDKLDAKLIRDYCELFNPNIWRPVSKEIQILKDLVKRTDELMDIRQQETNRLEKVSSTIKPSIQKLISYLDEEIKKLEKSIKQHINQHVHLKEQSDLLRSIPAISDKTINKVLSFLAHIDKFDNAKKVVAFIGLNPHVAQSGTSLNYSHLSKTGSSNLRKILYMPALVATKHNAALKLFYNKLLAKGKPKKVALCAVMRKLVHIIYGVLKSKQPFDDKLCCKHP